MVQLIQQGVKGLINHIEIHDPAGLRIDFALDSDANVIRVAVQARTFMPLRDVGEEMRCFKAKICVELHRMISQWGLENFAAILHGLSDSSMPMSDAENA